MKKNPRDIIFEPVVSEKSYELIEQSNTYTFLVDPRANKTQIKQAIAEIFEVTVRSVNTINRCGKWKRTGNMLGKRSDSKRALVTLDPDDEIELFGV